jgi:hypothetical protein
MPQSGDTAGKDAAKQPKKACFSWRKELNPARYLERHRG